MMAIQGGRRGFKTGSHHQSMSEDSTDDALPQKTGCRLAKKTGGVVDRGRREGAMGSSQEIKNKTAGLGKGRLRYKEG